LRVLASTPVMTSSLALLSVADLDIVQSLLRTELMSTSFAVHHQGAAYKAAFDRMEEVNRFRMEKLQLGDAPKTDTTSAIAVDEAVAVGSKSSK
jgi:hypothetical protein